MQREYEVLGGRLQIHLGDITRLQVDAIVNSENSDLLMDRPDGPSVSAAIRRVEGDAMADDLAKLGPVEAGRAVVLPARHLSCRWVIHAATVVATEAGHESSPAIIRAAVQSALQLAAGLGLSSVALPAFGVRAADVPPAEASQAMVQALVDALKQQTSLRRVVVALLDPEAFLAFYEEAVRQATEAGDPILLRLSQEGSALNWGLPQHGAHELLAPVDVSPSQLVELRDRVGGLRRADRRRLLDPAQELRTLSERVESLIPAAVRELLDDIQRPLVLSVSEELAWIPLELAHAGGAEPLALRTPVARRLRTSRANGATRARPDGAPLEALILSGGDPEALPAAAREARDLADLLWRRAAGRARTTLLAGPRAGIGEVLDALAASDLVHWCGHTGGEEAPHWDLGPDALKPERVSALAAGPRIVVANSCGPTDHHAFLRAFLQAGTQHYLGTWWQIEDGLARSFAIAFFEQLVLGRSVGEALLQTRRALRAQDPLHWAAYWHYGDPRERPFQPQGL